jgi:hypothetical protein
MSEKWILLILVISGIVLMNLLLSKSKKAKDDLRKRKEKIKRRNDQH